jgi:ferredoxin
LILKNIFIYFISTTLLLQEVVMALMIKPEECTNCGICMEECPNKAISEGSDSHVINRELCTECVGAFDTPQCREVCPLGEDCIVSDPAHKETREQLEAKYKKIHG